MQPHPPPVLPDAKYAASHEWAKVDGDTATVGISDHAQSELGDVVYVELPEVGATVTKGETFGVVESVKVGGRMGGAAARQGRGAAGGGAAAAARSAALWMPAAARPPLRLPHPPAPGQTLVKPTHPGRVGRVRAPQRRGGGHQRGAGGGAGQGAGARRPLGAAARA
jgi:hypothetical protein